MNFDSISKVYKFKLAINNDHLIKSNKAYDRNIILK